MKKYGFVYVTTQSRQEAQKIARICLDKKLAACVNIFPSILSCYEWKGQYTEEKETVLILKTSQDLFEDLRETVIDHHSYTCPCVVFIPISKVHSPFLSWMDSQLIKSFEKQKD